MYKTLTIGGKDYHLEYTLEASLCSDCIDRLIEFLGGVSGSAYLADDALAELDPDSRKKVIKESVEIASDCNFDALCWIAGVSWNGWRWNRILHA